LPTQKSAHQEISGVRFFVSEMKRFVQISRHSSHCGVAAAQSDTHGMLLAFQARIHAE
jgi:hypothetical protein